jgi:hypothetical protein
MVKNNIGAALNKDTEPNSPTTQTPNSRNLIDYAQLPKLKTITAHHNNPSAVTPETILNAVDN